MAGNSYGKLFRLTSFGESHGVALGGIVDGCPSGIELDITLIQNELDRRRPGYSHLATARKEEDQVEILSGIYNGYTTGMPVAFLVKNKDQRSTDYSEIAKLFRPSHADYTWESKYGIRDPRGGGRSSAREHIARVVAGAIAKQVLNKWNIKILAYTSQIGNIDLAHYPTHDFDLIHKLQLPTLNEECERMMVKEIEQAKADHDSIGGVVSCHIQNLPVGVGEPVFDRLQAHLAFAMLSINAAKGFEYGMGFNAAKMRGSQHNDPFIINEKGNIATATNFSGGIQGGVSNGEEVNFRVAFKPIATISQEQNTVTKDKEEIVLKAKGRHDPCVIPRAIPVVEAMCAITLLDLILQAKASAPMDQL